MTMMKLACVLLLAQTTAGFAQSPAPALSGHSAATGFRSIDQDRDGRISPSEWSAAGRAERGFQAMDADKDGALTQSEFTTGLQRVQQQRASSAARPSLAPTAPGRAAP